MGAVNYSHSDYITLGVKPYRGRKYNPAFVWVCVG